ncbi:hypothetical protein BGZ54_003104, partial [Gamsiella multidivaricata]
MPQRTFSTANGSGTPLAENISAHNHLHHSPSSGLLNRNTASRPGSPSNIGGAISMSSYHQHSSSVASVHSNGSSSNLLSNNGNANGISSGGYEHGTTGSSSSSVLDHSISVGNSGYFKRSKYNSGLHSLLSPKRWRWWNYTAAVLLVFALVEGLVLLIGSTVLYSLPDQIQI